MRESDDVLDGQTHGNGSMLPKLKPPNLLAKRSLQHHPKLPCCWQLSEKILGRICSQVPMAALRSEELRPCLEGHTGLLRNAPAKKTIENQFA